MAVNQLLTKLNKYFLDSDYRFIVNAGKFKHFPWMDDKRYIERMFRAKLGYKLDLNNPRTFNEKLQWLKLNDRNPAYSIMVDKYAVKEYVAQIIGKEYIIPTLGVWESVDDIDFKSLPDKFVLKCTHDSHGIVICKDKKNLNIKAAKRKLSKALKTNYYYFFREWPYKNVKPRIIAEEYMEDKNARELRDYKFFCFDGIAKCFKIDFDRFTDHHANYFDMNHNLLSIGECVCPPDPSKVLELPDNITLMGKLGELLSKSIPFLRTDFYDVEGKIYFGELTFFPASGFGKFINSETDIELGTWIKLPEKIGGGGGYCLISERIVCFFCFPKDLPLKDYKIYTFNGKAKMCMINQERGIHTRADYFDRDYNWLDFTWGYDHAEEQPKKPVNYDLMYRLAEELAQGTAELRVDFYEVNGKLFFGELTFYDGSGFDRIEPTEWDYKLGKLVSLPIEIHRRE